VCVCEPAPIIGGDGDSCGVLVSVRRSSGLHRDFGLSNQVMAYTKDRPYFSSHKATPAGPLRSSCDHLMNTEDFTGNPPYLFPPYSAVSEVGTDLTQG
jgi:hypothetical protein